LTFRLIIERNDFASRGAEGLKQVRAMHVPEFEAEEQSTPSESGNAKTDVPETETKSEATPEKYFFIFFYFFLFFLFFLFFYFFFGLSNTNLIFLKIFSAPNPDPVVSFVEAHASGVSAKFKLDILRGQVLTQ